MARGRPGSMAYEVLVLEGIRYAVVRERDLAALCRRAGVEVIALDERAGRSADLHQVERLDGRALAERLTARRRDLGITQAALARRADVRVETLNRIERGKVTPDFATIRKLVVALRDAEVESDA